ncbi:MAG TPA: AI-2E family transporter, partial [Bacteroidales bacterium]|nr:AI-2E family transporter [Bacteroidales bacterium]
LFLPLMRWLHKYKVPKTVSVILIIIVFIGILKTGGELIQLSVREIMAAEGSFFQEAESNLMAIIISVEEFFGIERIEGENLFVHYFKNNSVFNNFGSTINFIGDTLSMVLLTVFFTVLLLSESINFQMVLNKTIFDSRYSSIRTFVKIEHDVLMFVKVKFIVSLLTGIGVGVACMLFGISFPVFWGLLTFIFNFVQVVGSIASVAVISLFAFIELDPTGTLVFFILTIAAVQVLMGSILEPIMMGKTFSINIVSVLIMLMLWGYIWGIPGMIMSVPITVILKIIMEQFPRTRIIASLMGGFERPVVVPWKRKKSTKAENEKQEQ